MRGVLTSLSFLIALAARAEPVVLDVGDPVPNLCWKNELDKSVCLDDNPGRLRVLVYASPGTKGGDDEVTKLVARGKELQEEPVTFLVLVSGGEALGTVPDGTTLARFREKLAIPFPVVASPRDPGRRFFARPGGGVPAVVVIDGERRIVHKAQGPNVEDVVRIVKKILVRSNARLAVQEKLDGLATIEPVLGPAR